MSTKETYSVFNSKKEKEPSEFLYKTLYRRKAGQRPTYWSVSVEREDGKVFVVKRFGTYQGKERITKREIKKLGRSATLFEQGKAIAKKNWTDKKKKDGYFSSLKKCQSTEEKKENSFVGVMLAKNAVFKNNQVKGMKYPFYCQPKVDGNRLIVNQKQIISPNGPHQTGIDRMILRSRGNTLYLGYPSLRKELAVLYSLLPKEGFGSGEFYLDGELYIEGTFEKLSSELSKARNRPKYEPDNLVYNVFDCFDLSFMETPFSERNTFLQNLIEKAKQKTIFFLKGLLVENDARLKSYYSYCMSKRFEGLMLRNLKSPYQPRKRSPNLLKYKKFDDDEFKIVGFKEASGTEKGLVIWKCMTKDGKTFDVRPKGTRGRRQYLFTNGEKYVGREDYTVIYFGLTEYGVPRFPVGKGFRNGDGG